MSHTMMVFSACVNDTVHILYMLFKSFLWWAMVHHVTFSSPPEFGGYQCISKVQNTFQYFNRLVWYFITLYHLIKLWYLTVNLSWYHIFYGRTLATTAAIFFTVMFFYSVGYRSDSKRPSLIIIQIDNM